MPGEPGIEKVPMISVFPLHAFSLEYIMVILPLSTSTSFLTHRLEEIKRLRLNFCLVSLKYIKNSPLEFIKKTVQLKSHNMLMWRTYRDHPAPSFSSLLVAMGMWHNKQYVLLSFLTSSCPAVKLWRQELGVITANVSQRICWCGFLADSSKQVIPPQTVRGMDMQAGRGQAGRAGTAGRAVRAQWVSAGPAGEVGEWWCARGG